MGFKAEGCKTKFFHSSSEYNTIEATLMQKVGSLLDDWMESNSNAIIESCQYSLSASEIAITASICIIYRLPPDKK